MAVSESEESGIRTFTRSQARKFNFHFRQNRSISGNCFIYSPIFYVCLLSQFCYANDHLLRNRNILVTMSSSTSVIRNFESSVYKKEYINNCYMLYAC